MGQPLVEAALQALDGSFQLILWLLENNGVLDAFDQFNGYSASGVANHDQFSKQLLCYFFLEFNDEVGDFHLCRVELQILGLSQHYHFLAVNDLVLDVAN